jgi:hypothetical protein
MFAGNTKCYNKIGPHPIGKLVCKQDGWFDRGYIYPQLDGWWTNFELSPNFATRAQSSQVEFIGNPEKNGGNKFFFLMVK